MRRLLQPFGGSTLVRGATLFRGVARPGHVDETASAALRALNGRRWSLAVAESCTGGLLGAVLTRVPGASETFRGGIITYVDDVKRDVLGIEDALLQDGAVRAEVTQRMASAVRERLRADVGAAITCFAGPNAPEGTHVGTSFVAVASPSGVRTEEHRFEGDREHVRSACVDVALRMLRAAAEERPLG